MNTTSRRRRYLLWGSAAGFAILISGATAWFWSSTAGSDELTPVPSLTHEFAGNHLHGIGYAADRDEIYLASHFGLFLLRDDQLYQIGESRDDYMGFSARSDDPNTFFASGHPATGGNLGVIVTRDAGMNWEQIFTGVEGETVDFHAMVVSPADPERLYGVYNGRFYAGNVADNRWRLADGDGMRMEGFCWGVPCLSADGDDRNRVIATNGRGIHITDDAGDSWELLSDAAGGAAGIAAHPERPDILLAHTEADGVALSEDGGTSWSPRNEGMDLQDDFIFDFSFNPDDPDHAFAASATGYVFETTDRGQTWETVMTPEAVP